MEKIAVNTKTPFNGTIVFTKKDLAKLFIGSFAFFLSNISIFGIFNPIAFAYLLNFICTGSTFYYVFVFTSIGLLVTFEGIFLFKYVLCLAVLFFLNVYMHKIGKPTIILKAITGSVVVFIAGALIAIIDGMSLYFMCIAAVEAFLTFTLTLTLEHASKIISKGRHKRVISNEEMLSIAVLIGGILVGSANTFVHSDFATLGFLTLTALIAAYKGGSAVSTMTTFIATCILLIFGYAEFFIMPILCMGAVCSGFFRDKGKIFVILGFGVGTFMCAMYFSFEMITIYSICAVLVGSTIFFFMKDDFHFNFHNLVSPQIDSSEEYISRVKEILDLKLNGFSYSFKKLSKTFSSLSEKKTTLAQEDISILIDEIACKACSECEMRKKCWEENFYETYQMVFEIIGNCERSGNNSHVEMSSKFLEGCGNSMTFAMTANRLYEIHRSNLKWHNKIVESRELVSDQLMGVSNIIKSLADELDLHMNFKEEIEENLILELNKNKIEVDSVIVLENKEGKYEVTINKHACTDGMRCKRDIVPIISKIIGRRMRSDLKECNYRGEGCKIRLVEEQKLRITSGVAKGKKVGSKESGDSYSILEMKNGQSLLALSDGMGSGTRARKESVATVELLEDFIESGFDKELAVKMINSVLMLKSSEDSFSTLDICSVNMYTGEAEFIKIGASVTFLVRRGEVQSIKSSSLPIGILKNVDIEMCTKKLMNNDIIVMVTDGAGEIPDAYGEREKWIIEAIKMVKSNNPQEIANHLLEEVEKMMGGIFLDDVTILVAKLWERP